jgi:adenosylcobinamide kinase/adenosylcobinamide-phosphate guanylyltransferase
MGGARGGKSTFAERLAARQAATLAAAGGGTPRVTFLATSEANDPEMVARVAAHRAARSQTWVTLECPLEAGAAVRSTAAGSIFLLDCVTFWISNLLFAAGGLGGTEPQGLGNFDKTFIPREIEETIAARVTAALDDLLAALGETGSTMIAVSNEVGLGVVPEYPIARLYRDELGRANRRLADAADSVYLLVAGIPVELKALAADPFAPRTLSSSPTEEESPA